MRLVKSEIEKIRETGLFRKLRTVSTPQEAVFTLDGSEVVNFSGNNTLGLATHPALARAAENSLQKYGMGSGASRLISGNMTPHEELEKELAVFTHRERALYFPSGYQANIGVIPALAGKGDVILSDELNHASLIDGIRLSGAERRIYPHNNVSKLEQELEAAPDDSRVLVVTESLFSMEGDRAPLVEILKLKGRVREFLLYLDEAHAMAAIGPLGAGIAAESGAGHEVDLVLGTLGKGFGVGGAFIASEPDLIELVINRARSFIYTTAPPPHLAAAASAALKLVLEGDSLRERLRQNSDALRERIERNIGQAPSGCDHIIPVLVPGVDKVMAACAGMLDEGIFCQGIRPPTVPHGRCRLRFSVSAAHTAEHLEAAAEALKKVLSGLK